MQIVITEEDGGVSSVGNTTSGIDISEVPYGAMKRRKIKTFSDYLKGRTSNGKNQVRNDKT